MGDEKISKGKIIGKIILSLICSIFLFFVFAFIVNALIGKNKSPAHYKLFWNSTVNIIKGKINMFVYVGIAIVILSFGFIFWRQFKMLGKKSLIIFLEVKLVKIDYEIIS